MSQNVVFNDYIIARPNKFVEKLNINGEEIPLSRKAKSQLRRLLKNNSEQIRVTVGNFNGRKYIVRVTSLKFQHVLHSELEDIIRMALATVFEKGEFEVRRVNFSRGIWIEVFRNGQRFLGFYNYNDAKHAIRIWLYLAPFPVRIGRIIHRAKNREIQKQKLVKVLKNIIENLDNIKQRIESLKELELSKEEFVEDLKEEGFPQYIIRLASRKNFNRAWNWIWWLAAQVFKKRKKSLLDLYEKFVQKYVALNEFIIDF